MHKKFQISLSSFYSISYIKELLLLTIKENNITPLQVLVVPDRGMHGASRNESVSNGCCWGEKSFLLPGAERGQ